jgi:hypothetical protein
MGNGASSAPKQNPAPTPNDGLYKTSSSRGRISKDVSEPGKLPPPGVAMRAPWGSCVLSLHVAHLFSKLDFDVSQNADLGCLHSVAARCATEGDTDHPSNLIESPFAPALRELGELPYNALKEQSTLFKDASDKLEDFHEFASTYARIFCNDHIRSSFQRKKSNVLVGLPQRFCSFENSKSYLCSRRAQL